MVTTWDLVIIVLSFRHHPQILGHSGKVDSLSLYLSLLDNEDERVQQALNK